jgi:hypothetical protein
MLWLFFKRRRRSRRRLKKGHNKNKSYANFNSFAKTVCRYMAIIYARSARLDVLKNRLRPQP